MDRKKRHTLFDPQTYAYDVVLAHNTTDELDKLYSIRLIYEDGIPEPTESIQDLGEIISQIGTADYVIKSIKLRRYKTSAKTDYTAFYKMLDDDRWLYDLIKEIETC